MPINAHPGYIKAEQEYQSAETKEQQITALKKMVSEVPKHKGAENLRKLLQKKLHTNVSSDTKNYAYFNGFKIIRSTELVYIAYKKNLCELKDKKILEAMLYGVKYKGCSVSEEEIGEVKNS